MHCIIVHNLMGVLVTDGISENVRVDEVSKEKRTITFSDDGQSQTMKSSSGIQIKLIDSVIFSIRIQKNI